MDQNFHWAPLQIYIKDNLIKLVSCTSRFYHDKEGMLHSDWKIFFDFTKYLITKWSLIFCHILSIFTSQQLVSAFSTWLGIMYEPMEWVLKAYTTVTELDLAIIHIHTQAHPQNSIKNQQSRKGNKAKFLHQAGNSTFLPPYWDQTNEHLPHWN